LLAAAERSWLDGVPAYQDPVFGLEVPTQCPGVPSEILYPQKTWEDAAAFDRAPGTWPDASRTTSANTPPTWTRKSSRPAPGVKHLGSLMSVHDIVTLYRIAHIGK
jgi:hypothetical protein